MASHKQAWFGVMHSHCDSKALPGLPTGLFWCFYLWDTCVIGFSDQLYVVDASLLELLQSPFGLFLQRKCKTLESLCTLVQAKLHGDLRDRKIKQMAKPRRAHQKKNQKAKNQTGPNPCSRRRSPDSSAFLLRTTERSESVSNKLNQH